MYGRSKDTTTTLGMASALSDLANIDDSYCGCLSYSDILFKVKSIYLIKFNEYIDSINSMVPVNYKEISDYAMKIIATRISIAYPPVESSKDYCNLFDVDRYIPYTVIEMYKSEFSKVDVVKQGFSNYIKRISVGGVE